MTKQRILASREICNGCGLCVNMCKDESIRMKMDHEGFLYPSTNGDIDKDNFLPNFQCPQLNHCSLQKRMPSKIYACQIKDKDLLIESTAGGLFPIMAKCILNQGGVVFGAAYNENMRVVHRAALSMDDVKKFNGSKYIQSDITEALGEVRSYLIDNKIVLFSGTPCQIRAVLDNCFDCNLNNLITMDVVCYGVPSPGLFRAYIDIVEKKYKKHVIDFRFRDKHTNGWSHTTVITLADDHNNTIKIEEPNFEKIPYFKMFSERNCFRKSCYHCQYNTQERISDITTGNFWGIEKISDCFDTKLGVSMALINTPKGDRLFNMLSSSMIVEERSLKEALDANDALIKTTPASPKRDKVFKSFQENGFRTMYLRYYQLPSILHPCKRIKRFLKESSIAPFLVRMKHLIKN